MTETPPEKTHLLALSTCPDEATAKTIADALIEQRLAACINILPGIQSVYRWQGAIEHDQEVLLLIKTNRDAYPQLEKTIAKMHPYELPEVITVSIEDGLAAYLAWIDDSVVKPE